LDNCGYNIPIQDHLKQQIQMTKHQGETDKYSGVIYNVGI